MTNENVENVENRGDLSVDSTKSTPKTLLLSEFMRESGLKPDEKSGKFIPKSRHIKDLVNCTDDCLEKTDKLISLKRIDTRDITSMNRLFENSTRTKEEFDGIEDWNTSNVTSFAYAFSRAEYFNSDISGWDVSKGKGFYYMFFHAHNFNQPIGEKWHTKSAKNMRAMFCFATKFNNGGKDFGKNWVMDNVDLSAEMFYNTDNFNAGGLNEWNMTNIKKCWSMFRNAKAFNQPLDKWDMPNCDSFYSMFYGAESFNQNLSAWGTRLGKVKGMEYMFANTKSLNQTFDWQILADCYTDNIIKGSPLQLKLTKISDGKEQQKEILQDSSQNAIDSVKQAYQLASDIKEFRIYQIVKNDKNLIDKDYKNALDSFVNPQEWQKCDRKELYSWLPKNIRQSFEIYLSKKQGDKSCKADESKWDFICYKVFDYIFMIEVGDKENILNISQNALKKHDKRTLIIKQEPFDDDDEDYDFGERKIHYQSNSLHISLEDSNEMYIYNGNTNKDTQNSNRILNIIGALILAKAYESKMYDFNKMARSTKGANLMQCHKEICAFDLKYYQDTPVLVYNSALVEFWEELSKRYKINDKHKELQETITRIAQLVSDEIRERENESRNSLNTKIAIATVIIGFLSLLGAILAAIPVIQNLLK
ncbi:BspA family leucine-rich repeat surface protein [Helicobacter sp. 23-1048]